MQTQTLLLIIGAAIIAMGVAVFQYFYKAKFKTKRNIWYALLRFCTVFGLLLLLINPKYKQVSYDTVKPSLAVAIDNSASIDFLELKDDVEEALARFGASEPLSEAFDVQLYRFGKDFASLDSLSFAQKQTNIASALRNLEDIYGSDVAPVVLLTDGNQTYGEAYQYSTKNYKQQVYPVILGDTIVYDDLKLGQINVNRYAYINNKFPIEIFTSYNGSRSVTSMLSVKSGSKTLYTQRLSFSPENASQVVNVLIPAEVVGVQQFTISLAPIAQEKNTKNNYKRIAIEVIDQKTNVLIVSNVVHPDMGMLKKSIESNRLRTVTFSKAKASIDKINEYELIILYQPDGTFKEVYEQLVSLNKNSITIAGASADWVAINKYQEVVRQEITGQTEDVQAVLNPNFSAFVIENIGFSDYPPLKAAFGDVRFTSTTDVAFTQRIGALSTENPLIATTDDNGRRGVYILGEGLWRWRAQHFIDKRSFEGFDNFIDNLVQYAASNKKKSRLNLDYESFYYGNGDVTLYAQYFDKNYSFDSRAQLSIRVQNKETKEVVNIPLLLKRNTYQVAMNNLAPGDYTFTVTVKDQGLSQSGSFTIVPFEIEQQFLNANIKALQEVAINTEASLFTVNQIETLINQLVTDNRYKPIQKSTENIVPLVEWKWLLALLALLLAIEWFMRKYNGLT